MKRSTRPLNWLLLCGLALVGAPTFAEDASALQDGRDRLSYALGMDLGNQMRGLSVDLDPAVFARGLTAGLSGGESLMTKDEVGLEIGKLQIELRDRQIAAKKKAEEERAKAGGAGAGEGAPVPAPATAGPSASAPK
jgi:hypothetical protein